MRLADLDAAIRSRSGILAPPVFPGDATRTRRARALHSILLTSLSIIFLVFALGIPFIFTAKLAAAVIGVVMLLITFVGAWMNRRGYVDVGCWTTTAGLWLVVTGVAVLGGGITSIAPMGYLAVVTTGIWLLGRRAGLALGSASVLAGLGIAAAAAYGVQFPRLLPMRPLTSWLYLTFALAGASLPMVLAIRDLKEALRESKRSRSVTDAIVDHIPGIFSQLDEQGHLLQFNSRLSEITGIDPSALSKMPSHMLLAEEDRVAAQEALRQCFSEGHAVAELSVCAADGSLIPHLFYGARMVLDGSPIAVVIGLDLLERRQAEMALRKFEERYRDFLERVHFAAITTDPEGVIEFANHYFQKVTSWSPAELIGRPFLKFIDEADQRTAVEALGGVLGGHENLVLVQTKLRARTGHPRILQWNISPIVSPEGVVRGATCLGIDLTERHLLEAQLQHSQKMDSLGRLAAGVAHDFNNLLTVIGGFAEVLDSPDLEHEERAHAAGEITAASKRAAALTRQLLAFSRRQVLSPQTLDLNGLVLDARRLLDRLLGAGIRIDTKLAPGELYVRADPGQLHQVIMNLAVNSRDAMPDGGALTLSTNAADGFHELVVSDTGCGMDEETRTRAFEPFFTTKGSSQNSGLGLAMVFGIVDQSQGSVRIESTRGAGTVVTVQLPAASAGPVAKVQIAPALQSRPLRILLAEDEPGVRDLVSVILKDVGHSVIPASDGPNALEEAERAEFEFDAAVVDVVMPYMSGPELVSRLRLKRPALPVVFISGYSTLPPEEIQGNNGQTEYVQKPFQAEELLAAIGRAVGT